MSKNKINFLTGLSQALSTDTHPDYFESQRKSHLKEPKSNYAATQDTTLQQNALSYENSAGSDSKACF
jgi:hypothetical protein